LYAKFGDISFIGFDILSGKNRQTTIETYPRDSLRRMQKPFTDTKTE